MVDARTRLKRLNEDFGGGSVAVGRSLDRSISRDAKLLVNIIYLSLN